MEVLQDKTGALACLVDCRLQGELLLCGAAVFRGGLRGVIDVGDEQNSFFIEVPESVADVATYVTLHNPETQYLELRICLSKPQLENPENQKLLA